MSSVDYAKQQGYEYAPFGDVSPLAHTSRVDTEMNVNWMRNNPELAVESIINFFQNHTELDFDHSIDPVFVAPNRCPLMANEDHREYAKKYMHLGYIKLIARRK